MMAIKSKLGDGKGETACIICALVVLALLFAGSIALVVVLHTKDINHSRTGKKRYDFHFCVICE